MKYPLAQPQPKTVTFGRVTDVDPYVWLEEDTPESLAWQAQQDDLTQAWLADNPARVRADALVASMPRIDSDFPVCGGSRWFRKRTPDGEAMPVAEVADDIKGPWRTLVDLRPFANGRLLTIDVFLPSPDGRKLILGCAVDGRELAELRVFDVDTGRVLIDGIPQSYAFFPAWLPDSTGFYIVASNPADMASGAKVYRHLLGREPATTPEVYEQTADLVWALPAGDGRHTMLVADHLNTRPDCIRDESANDGWRPFLRGETSQFRGGIVGDRFYAVTNEGAPRGRLVSIPLATPTDRGTWKELLPGSNAVLGTLLVVDGLLVLVDLVDTWSRVRVFDTDGRLQGEIPLPGRGAVSTMQFAIFNMMDMIWKGVGSEVLIPFSTPARSPALIRADVRTLAVETVIESKIEIPARIDDHWATSADGARVPYHAIARADLDPGQPRPTVMYGYGGFQAALVPGWSGAYLAGWIKAGGVLVLMHLRGGGELGPDMWHEGRLKLKQNTFNDVHAIAEDVIARGIATRDQLGVVGGSNGGVMASTVVVQRPDLYRASIAQVPITDALGRARDVICMSATLDYGDPHDPEMSEVLRAWSPYQNIQDGTAYPALLLDAGAQDVRCPPWHVRKMAARLQPANGGAHPVLMRVRAGSGHGAADVAGQRIQNVDWLTFFIDQLGLEPDAPKA